jgi:holo-[acyl-carrier protein] synthase
MILGIGTDIVNINRMRRILEKFPTLKKKILSNQEFEICQTLQAQQQARYLAKRFAAKEAIAKAIGVGIGIIGLSNISILNNNLGKPYVVINFDKNTPCAYHKNTCIEVSLSDERDYAIAFAIATAKL